MSEAGGVSRKGAQVQLGAGAVSDWRGKCPWPGPRPYGEEHVQVFHGRSADIQALLQLVDYARFAIVRGESGVGKTSLLRAGVVASLRGARLRQDGPSEAAVPPVVYLADWGVGPGARSVDELIGDKLYAQSVGLRDAVPEDAGYGHLAEATSSGTALERLAAACADGRELVVVIDQFEEILRSGGGARAAAIELVAKAFLRIPTLILVVSLRDEYVHHLSRLEHLLQPRRLLRHSYTVGWMDSDTVAGAVDAAASDTGLQIEPEARTMLLSWFETPQRHAEDGASDSSLPGDAGLDPTRGLDLLTMQAILRDLCERATELGGAHGDRVIDRALLAGYAGGRDVSAVRREALVDWIERALEQPAPTTTPAEETLRGIDDAAFVEFTREQWLTGLVKRVAVRVASSLSSGGYKQAVDEHALLMTALGEDLRTLHPSGDLTDRRSWQPDPETGRLDRAALELPEGKDEEKRARLSGIARPADWSAADTADFLVAVFEDALLRLQRAYVLKRMLVGDGVRWELVHDGLGEPLVRWADRRRYTLDDACFSVVARRGEDVYLERDLRGRVLPDLCWWGCVIEPYHNEVLDRVEFRSCDLRGTMFINCTFLGGAFVDCIMDGVLFISCKFALDRDGNPLTFERCSGTGMAFWRGIRENAESWIDGMLFLDSDMFRQLEMGDITVRGTVEFRETRLFQFHFEGLRSEGSAKILIDSDCTVDYCAWDETSGGLLEVAAQTHMSGMRRDGADDTVT